MNPTTIIEAAADAARAVVSATQGDVFGFVSNLSKAMLRVVTPDVANQAIRDEWVRIVNERADARESSKFLNDPKFSKDDE